MWHIYIVRCSDNSLYTGITNNLEHRIKIHNDKKGGYYTRSRTPVKLIYEEPCDDRSKASQREYQIKTLSRKEKLALIRGNKAGLFKASRSRSAGN